MKMEDPDDMSRDVLGATPRLVFNDLVEFRVSNLGLALVADWVMLRTVGFTGEPAQDSAVESIKHAETEEDAGDWLQWLVPRLLGALTAVAGAETTAAVPKWAYEHGHAPEGMTQPEASALYTHALFWLALVAQERAEQRILAQQPERLH